MEDKDTFAMTGSSNLPGNFRPRITLQTLGRGEGLLGMKPSGVFGPRGGSVTVVQIDWLYSTTTGLSWQTPAPITLLNRRPSSSQPLLDADGHPVTLLRDLGAEADALDKVWELDLQPLPLNSLQWRSKDAAIAYGPLWSLLQEDFFGDFWAEQLPQLQALGWSIVVRPGFAHESVMAAARASSSAIRKPTKPLPCLKPWAKRWSAWAAVTSRQKTSAPARLTWRMSPAKPSMWPVWVTVAIRRHLPRSAASSARRLRSSIT